MTANAKPAFNGSFLLVMLFVFFNSVALPHGLLYTTLLTPFFVFWLWRKRVYKYLLWFPVVSVLLWLVHSNAPIDSAAYLKSSALYFATFIFSVAAWKWLKDNTHMDWYFKQILVLNTILLPIAVVAFAHPFTRNWFWYMVPFSGDMPTIPRLRMLTYEASYYSLLLAPLVLYYLAQAAFGKGRRTLLPLALVVIPLLLSFSLGVMASLAIACLGVLMWYLMPLAKRKRTYLHLFFALGGLLFVLLALYAVWPDNPLYTRLGNVLSHNDSSARGRTYEAFYLAGKLIWDYSVWFGVGPGQVKVLGHKLFSSFYQITTSNPYVAAIPNASAETLAVYGLTGFVVRLGFQLWAFVKFKVYRNLFSLGLFLFVFIYQFTGSYITSPLEYVLWLLAVLPLFPQFHKSRLFPQ